MALNAYQNRESPSWRILEYLQRKGAATIKELEDVLGVTTTAVRQQLQTLQADGYVERTRVHAGVGRPHHAYSLTAKAHELFSSHCDDLALTLLEEVFALEGEERAGQLLERVGSRLAKRYSPLVRSGRLKERVAQLAEALYARRLDGRIRKRRMCSFSRRTTAPITNWRTNTATSARWMRNSCVRCWVGRKPAPLHDGWASELQVRRPPQFTRKIVNCELEAASGDCGLIRPFALHFKVVWSLLYGTNSQFFV